MEQYARYRAPAESGQKLVSPPWAELGLLLDANQSWRRGADVEILGQSLAEFSSEARGEVVQRAKEYVAAYHSGCVAKLPEPTKPLILTGHQPELVHPGVWYKNFAAAALARAYGGLALNLVIDADACRNTTIRLPGGSLSEPRFTSAPFDAPAEAVPWEERGIVDTGVWESFADRVRRETTNILPERLLDSWWPVAIERAQATGRLGASLAQARHLTELQWGERILELPQSAMCQTVAFRRFVCHVLRELPRFVDAYNGALAEYRRTHHIRNRAHPVSNLATPSPWLQAPFWVWTSDNPRRRSVYARREGNTLVVSDRRSFERSLPISESGDPNDAVAELARWETEGLKLRSRALVTTMFARLALADLFIHGIGGAKYDEATDATCRRFFSTPPPRFATISGTLRLPIARTGLEAGGARNLQQRLRDLQYHPEQFVQLDGAANATTGAARLVAEKRAWVQTPKTPNNAGKRHHAITAANTELQPFVVAQRAAVERQLAESRERSRADRVLNSREYSFCLFPPKILEQFLLDFPS